jgi:hypothetical protein
VQRKRFSVEQIVAVFEAGRAPMCSGRSASVGVLQVEEAVRGL